MTDAAAISATFADFKLVKTRSIAQLVFEVPVENADAALQALGGLPQASGERWCAIARLVTGKPASEATRAIAPPDKERKRFDELRPSAQAGIRCADKGFWQFLTGGEYGSPIMSSEDAAEEVRAICRVASRAELDTDPKAAERWRALDNNYVCHQRGYE